MEAEAGLLVVKSLACPERLQTEMLLKDLEWSGVSQRTGLVKVESLIISLDVYLPCRASQNCHHLFVRGLGLG